MRWDILQRTFLVYRGGDDKQSTQVNQLYSPEEAAQRSRVMSNAANIYNTASGRTFNQEAYNQAMAAYTQAIQGPGIFKKTNVPLPNPEDFYTVGPGTSQAPAGPSEDTLAAQARLRAFSTGPGEAIAGQAAQALKFGLGDVLYPESNPALQATLGTATRNVNEAYMGPGGAFSQIRSNFAAGNEGGRGSREAIALGLAGRSYLNTIGDVTGKITSDAYSKGLDTFGRSMAFAPNLYNLGAQPALTQSAVGQQQEAYAEEQRQFGLNAPWLQLQNYANIVFGGSSPGSMATSTGPGVTGTQRAGLALSGAAMGYQTTGSPYGAAAGAAIGLLMSYMS